MARFITWGQGLMVFRHSSILVAAVALGTCHDLTAEEPALRRTIGNQTYQLRLAFADNFDNLDHWAIESTGRVTAENHQLVWPCYSDGKDAGTLWCKHKFSGPTVVEFDAIAEAGARNLNFIFYAKHPKGLLETSNSRTGQYGEYHDFANYIITYLTPPVAGKLNVYSETQWRIRFRKNPGFHLLSERTIESTKPTGRAQRITYVLNSNGRMSLLVDGVTLHTHTDQTLPLRDGYHGLRTWNSDVRYFNFKVYSILSQDAVGTVPERP